MSLRRWRGSDAGVRPASRAIVGLCVAAALLFDGGSAFAAKSTLRAMEMNGYGRAVFSFEDLPKATVKSVNGVMLVTFDRPVDFSVEKLTSELPSYISAVRLDPDNKTVRMALQKPLRANLMEAGDKLFLDFLPDNWKGLPPSLPREVIEDLSRRAKEAEDLARKLVRKKASEEVKDLTFRVGTTPTFSRLVFELPVFAPVDLSKDQDRVDLAFLANLRLDAARLKAALPSLIKDVQVETADGQLKIGLTTAPGVDVRGFREDDNYVLDLAPPKPPAKTAGGKNPPSPEAAPKGEAGAKPAEAAAVPAPTPFNAVTAPIPAFPRAADAEDRGLSATPAQYAEIKVGVSAERGSVRLNLPISPAVGLAVFDRAGVVWIAAETEAPFEPSQIGMVAPGLITKADVRRVGRLSILRLSLSKPALVRAAATEREWVVTIGDELVAQSGQVAFTRGAAPDGRTVVRAAYPDVASVHWVEDPEAGDKLAIVAGRRGARGVVKAQGFVDFRVLPSAQGVVVIPSSDDVAVRAGVDDVSITRDGGLVVSALPELPLPAREGAEGPRLAVDKEAWAQGRAGAVRDHRRALERAAADAPRSSRADARLNLARFELAAGLAQEAVGTIEVAVADSPDVGVDKSTQVLLAAAQVMAGRASEGVRLLSTDALANEPEALLWRAYADAQQRRWPQALAGYRRAAPVLAAYPDDLQAMMLPAFAEAALEGRDFSLAQRLLDQVQGHAGTKADRDYALLVAARVAEGVGRVEEAQNAYEKLAKTAVRPVEAAARLYGIVLGLKDHTLDRKAAVPALEVLSVAWRGDDIEIRTLATLGRLYAEEERWRNAFQVARQASLLYPDHEVTRSLYDEAATRFEALFLEGKADTIPRLDALALYFDFKEFTPPGRRGDEMIRRLAERLVALDLLGEATDLMQYQVDNRLNGAAKAAIASRLAVLYLMNRQPAKAYRALTESRLAELPQEMKRGRTLLEARALSDLSRTDLALEIIDPETGPDVERLRADILWQGRRWREAGEVFERMVGDRWQGATPLTDGMRADVMRAAIAYGLGDEGLALERLRAKFSTKMADSADAKSFSIVTSPSGMRSGEYRDVARSVASADTLSEFLSEYRKRYPETPALPPRAARKPKPGDPAPPPPAVPPQAGATEPGKTEPGEGKKAENKTGDGKA